MMQWPFVSYKISITYPILIRRTPHLFLEPPAEMLRILETKFVGNLADGLPCVEYTLFCHIQGLLLDMLQGGFARLLLQQVTQIVG